MEATEKPTRRAHNAKNREGERYNRWLIKSYIRTIGRRARYLCVCDCGKEAERYVNDIVKGVSKSCGCLNIENHIKHEGKKKHTRAYASWFGMKRRCHNENHSRYKWYGARGIIVCDKWRYDFSAFLKDMGDPPDGKYSVDRINNDGNYCPENCKWSTPKEQANNRRKPRKRLPLPTTPKP